MGLRLHQSLVGHSHNHCTTATPAHFIGRRHCSLKIIWLGWYLNPTTGNLSWLLEMASPGYISHFARSFIWDILVDSWEFSCTRLLPESKLIPLFSVIFQYSPPLPTPNLISHVPIPTYPQPTHGISSISHSQWNLMLTLEPSLLFLGLWILAWLSFTYS